MSTPKNVNKIIIKVVTSSTDYVILFPQLPLISQFCLHYFGKLNYCALGNLNYLPCFPVMIVYEKLFAAQCSFTVNTLSWTSLCSMRLTKESSAGQINCLKSIVWDITVKNCMFQRFNFVPSVALLILLTRYIKCNFLRRTILIFSIF